MKSKDNRQKKKKWPLILTIFLMLGAAGAAALFIPGLLQPADVEMIDVSGMEYEEAYSALQDVIQKLESGEHSLDESVSLYEQGRLLSLRCQTLLDNAELRIKQLNEDGSLTEKS